MGAPTSARASRPRRSRDEVWQRPVLAQPAAIKIVADFAKEIGAAKFFDAGDVQANGFQIVEDDRTGDTFTETGASYMGFAASALLASALRRQAPLRHRLLRRRLLHDEPADPDRRRRARRARHDRDLRQPPHGRDHRPAGGAVRRRTSAPTTASPSTTCGSPARSRASRAARRLDAPTSCSARCEAAHAHDGLSVVHVPVYCRRPTSSAASAPGASGTSATGARTCSASGSSRICTSPSPRLRGEVGVRGCLKRKPKSCFCPSP